jgi:hypothetical protein
MSGLGQSMGRLRRPVTSDVGGGARVEPWAQNLPSNWQGRQLTHDQRLS